MPADFPEWYVLLGCVEAEYHFGTSQRVVRRWMREYGEADLIQLRRAYLRKKAAAAGRTNVGGRKPGLRYGGFPEMPARDETMRPNPALAFMPVRRCFRPFPESKVWVRFPDGRQRPDEG